MRRALFCAAVLVAAGCGRPAVPIAAPAPAERTGRVVDADGPVAVATVRLQATSHTATTDADGQFRLPADPAPHVTATKGGYFIGFASPDASPLAITLRRLPPGDDPAYPWIDPGPDAPPPPPSPTRGEGAKQTPSPLVGEGGRGGSRARCHADIYTEWSSSAHSRSATGPHFRGLYDGTDWSGKAGVGWSLRDERPSGLGVCTSCHAPAVADDDPALLDLADLKGTAARGVHCDYCHKIAAIGAGKIGLTHGRFNLTLRRPPPSPPPPPSPTRGEGVRLAPSPLVGEGGGGGESAFFGPLDDATRGDDVFAPLYHDSRYCASCHEGVVFGVHVYSTYSEWQDSPAAKQGRQCQDCHMKPTGRMTNLAPGHGGVERDPQTLANHVFFDGGQEEMLRRCLHLSVERTPQTGGRAVVRLTAEGAGHRVPTGFIDKHLILIVEGEDASGQPVGLRDGPRLPSPAGKGLAGRPGKLYAKLLHDFDGHSPVPFWRADPDATDTRLEPGRTDETAYDFGPDLARLRVRVIYRRFWEEVARTKAWPDADVSVLEQTVSVSQPGKP